MHETTGRWRLGLTLALITVLMWGMLPIALKLLLDDMDAYTITWYRFLTATLLLGGWQAARGALPRVSALGGHGWVLLAVAISGLAGNYLFYLLGLQYVTPGTAQVVIQLAPVLLLAGGLVFFRERFTTGQWLSFAIMLGGLTLFFNDRLVELAAFGGRYAIGVGLIVAASVTWAAYALAQKQLLRVLSSENIMLCIYFASTLLFWPLAEPRALLQLSGAALALLVFCSLNTLVAYGAFAEALDHWEASRVSAVLAITPLLTLAFMAALAVLPGFELRERLNALSITGACLVVGGSMLIAMWRRPAPAAPAGAPHPECQLPAAQSSSK